MNLFSQDIYWMQEALKRAKKAATKNEVPVGAVIVQENEIVSEGYNQPIETCDPTAHAEIIALRQAGKKQKNYRLNNTTLYVTLEPCAMCLGAMINARIKRLVFGAFDPRAGAAGTAINLLQPRKLNHSIDVLGGVLAEESKLLLKDFFETRRE